MSQISIGILEDDLDQSALISLWLNEAGYDVTAIDNGPEFLRAVDSRGFDLLLLDWDLPGMSGIEVLKSVREDHPERLPVIFLTHRDAEENIVEALEAGSDDYVSKPARQAELLARVGALARRSGLMEPELDVLEVGDFVFNRELERVSRGGEPVKLAPREFKVAWYLFNNIGKILSREYLLRHVWNINVAIQTRTVDTHISRVRNKLGLKPENGWQLVPVYHYGYRLQRLDEEAEQG